MAFKKTYSAQTALKTCDDHEHEELDMYCRTCKKPICTVCVKKKHLNHDWDRMKKIAKELRADSIRRKLEIESVSKSMNHGTNGILDQISSNNEERFTKNISALESTRKAMYEIVDSAIDAMKNKCQTHKDKINKAVKNKKGQMKPLKDRLKFLLDHMEEAATDYTDYDVIEFHDELSELLTLLGTTAVIPPDFHEEIVYKKETLDKTVIISMLGSVDNVTKLPSSMSVVPVSQFSYGKNPVNCICPVSKDEAWVHCEKTTMNSLINLCGKGKKSLDVKCRIYNFAFSNTGETILCDEDARDVKCVEKSGEIKPLFSTFPLFPTLTTLTHSGDLLVSLVEKHSCDRTSSSRRLVRRVAKTGTVIREYEYDNDGKTPLFTLPYRSLELHNGNVCIINVTGNKSNDTLYGFDPCGDLKFKYNGTTENFNPLGLCCDMMGNILIADSCNKTVHLLDSEGKLLQHLLTGQTLTFEPYVIALYEDHLWISSRHDGQVKVYEVCNQ